MTLLSIAFYFIINISPLLTICYFLMIFSILTVAYDFGWVNFFLGQLYLIIDRRAISQMDWLANSPSFLFAAEFSFWQNNFC